MSLGPSGRSPLLQLLQLLLRNRFVTISLLRREIRIKHIVIVNHIHIISGRIVIPGNRAEAAIALPVHLPIGLHIVAGKDAGIRSERGNVNIRELDAQFIVRFHTDSL